MQCNLQSSLLTDLKIGKKSGFKKPSSWPDIRKNAPDKCIRLLVDDRYPIGFTATVTGGYSVNIDGEHYKDYNSQTQFSMADWNEYTDTEGYNINYPTNAVKAHIIDIYPQNSNDITAFKMQRVALSGYEEQGVLWEHFNLSTSINISNLNATGNIGSQAYKNTLLTACTAKNNKLNVTGDLEKSFLYCSNLEYLPVIDANNASINLGYFGFAFCSKIKKIDIKNLKFNDGSYAFHDNESLESLPKGIDYSSTRYMANYLTYAKNIKDFVFDVSSATLLRVIQCFGNSSTFMSGFKGLRVSSSAPFDGVSPQVDVSYTGMDRQALVTLFNDLPTVNAGQIINITGCTGAEDLTIEDIQIATNKGWTVKK